jgi:hypothetical protein
MASSGQVLQLTAFNSPQSFEGLSYPYVCDESVIMFLPEIKRIPILEQVYFIYGLLNFNSDTIASNGRSISGNSLNRCGKNRWSSNLRFFRHVFGGNCVKPWKSSVRLGGLRANIWMETGVLHTGQGRWVGQVDISIPSLKNYLYM